MRAQLRAAIFDFAPDAIMHLAAETHVDRSIDGPSDFMQTNVIGTYQLLEVAREYARVPRTIRSASCTSRRMRFMAALGATGLFTEDSPYSPNSPYSASKAGSDHLARAWFETYRLPVLVTNCSNNYGPYQFPEKLIPLTILKALQRPADSRLRRRNAGARLAARRRSCARPASECSNRGAPGRTYNIGGDCEQDQSRRWSRRYFVRSRAIRARASNRCFGLIQFVADRPGHDRRYAIDARRMRDELGWVAQTEFSRGNRRHRRVVRGQSVLVSSAGATFTPGSDWVSPEAEDRIG